MAETLTYRLDQFEGPLDLLLTLITKNKVSIEDIPISMICDQYLDYIAKCDVPDMDTASDFLVMASELVLIKTRMLLPRNEEDEEDPRAALAAALLEYQRIKGAAPLFAALYSEYGGRMVKDTDELPSDDFVAEGQDAERLRVAMNRILANLKPGEALERTNINPIIKKQIVPVSLKIDEVLSLLSVKRRIGLLELMSCSASRSELIASFIAVLELIKLGRITVGDETAEDGNVMIEMGDDGQTEIDISFENIY